MIAIGQITLATLHDGDSYVIQPSVSSVVIEDSGTYNPSEITFNNKHKQGNGELENYSGRLKIETTSDNTNWTTQYTSSSNETSKTYSLPSATIDKEPYNFRKSPVVSGAKSETIVGGTLAWNQLRPDNIASDTRLGITLSYNPNTGVITLSGTSTSTYRTLWAQRALVLNHKYLLSANTISNPNNVSFAFNAFNGVLSGASGASKVVNCILERETTTFGIDGFSENTVMDGISFTVQVIDLTTLFGSTIADYIYSLEQATAGAGVAWVKRYIDLDTYHEYCEPTLKSVEGLQSRDVVGFNQWDEEWELGAIDANGTTYNSKTSIRCKNFIPVLPSTTYYMYVGANVNNSPWFYDANKTFISRSSAYIQSGTFTTPGNCCYMKIAFPAAYGTTYNHDICINLSWSGYRDGEYEPYKKHSYPLDSSVILRGIPKLDSNNKLYFDGDEYSSDGQVTRRYGVVDLGSLNWTRSSSLEDCFYALISDGKATGADATSNGISAKYILESNIANVSNNDKTYALGLRSISQNSCFIVVHDSAYSDKDTFKTAMSGVVLVYELATPTTETAQPYQSPQLAGSTEEYVTSGVVPVGHESKYTSDIKNIRASLYKAGGTTALLNQITIPVLSQEDFTPKLINTIRQYTKSTSSTFLPSNPTWVDDEEPTIGDNEYMWARLKHVYSDGTFVYSNAVCSTSISGAIHDVDKANKSITDKVWESDITTKINQYDGSTVSTIRDRVSTTETDISSIKTRVSDVESETDDLGTRMTTAETAIEQTANNVLIKATESDTTAAQGGQHLIESLINVAPSGVTISADKVNIEGATIFSSGRLSQTSLNNAYDAKGAAATVQTNLDNLQIGGRNLARNTGERTPDMTSQVEWVGFDIGNLPITTNEVLTVSFDLKMVMGTAVTDSSPYLQVYNTNYKGKHGNWIYVINSKSNPVFIPVGNYPVGSVIEKRCSCTITTPNAFLEGTMTSDWIEFYSNYDTENAITITNIKVEKGNKPTSWTPAPEDVEADITNAQTTANSANKTTVPVYYRSTTNSTPSISASISIGTSNNTDNAWSYVMPLPKKNSYFYICEEYTSVSGTKTFSTVRKLDSQTYASKWVSSNDNTLIDGGSIYAHSITSSQLATDAIKSNNYQAAASGPYSVTGTFLDLSNGNFYTPNFGVQSLTGQAYLNGEIIATSGSIGDDSGNYWSIGNTIDSQGNGSASIVGNGTAFIQDGDWQIHSGLSNYSNGSINTQWYIQPQGQGLQLTYPYYDGYYYDYGMTSPVLDANSDRFYNQTVSQNFLYIRKHASTIPELESDWNYIFRIDKDGMIWINGQSLTQMIQSGVDGGAYLPTSGGTVNGNVTITGTLTATASKANQLTHTLSINGKGFDGSGDVNVGTIGAAYGGTGQTSLINSANALLNALGTGSSTPVDNDYYISQYVGGGTTTTTYHRRPMSALWSYIKGKLTADHSVLDSSYVLKSGDTITGSLTVENGIYSDSAQLGDLIVTGAGRFANGLYGDLIGNADTATKAAKVADSHNGADITLNYSGTNYSTTSWFAAWNGYQLGAISPANVLKTIGAVAKSGDTMTGTLTAPEFSLSGGINNTTAGFRLTNNGTNMDMGWTWTGVQGAGACFTSSSHPNQPGIFDFFARAKNSSNQEVTKHLIGNISGVLTWDGRRVVTATNSTAVGSISTPIYIDANGYAQVCTSISATTATKFSSAKTIKLTGDVIGSASSDGSSDWSIATTVADDSHNHTEFTIVPKVSKTYASTSYYASSTGNHDTATWYFISVKPDSWYKPWKIKFKMRSFCPSYTNVDSITESIVWGRADSITYSNYTEKYDNGHYYTGVRVLKKAGFDAGYSHAIGVDIVWSANYANSAYYRTFELDYYSCENCTVTVLDTPLLWANWSGGNSTNYNNITTLDAVTRGYTESGDRNELYAMGLRNYNSAYIKGAITAESVIVGDVDGYQQVASGVSFDMAYPILWSTGTLAVGAVNYANLFTQIYDRSITNIKSGFTSAANKVIYLVVTISGKTATVDSTVITDTLPTSDDGKVYIAIGRMGNNSNGQNYFFFWQEKPMYFYKNGAVRQYYNIANATTTADGLMSSADKTKLNNIAAGAQVNSITGVKGNSESSYRTGNVNITAANIGLGNLTNNKQVKGLSSGTTSGHFVTWGSDGYTVADSGITAGNVVKSVASNSDGQLVLTYADNTTSAPIDVEFVATETSSVQKAEALNVNGKAVGGADQPVYFTNQGKPTTANKIPKLNNATTGGTFYAPTGAGTSGQILQSSGGTPSWVNQSTLSVGSATKATQDSDGNTINSTYLKLSGGTLTGITQFNKTIRDASGQHYYGGAANRSQWYKIILAHNGVTPPSSAQWYMCSMTLHVAGDYNNNPRGSIELCYYIYWNGNQYLADKVFASGYGVNLNRVGIYYTLDDPFVIYVNTNNPYTSLWVDYVSYRDSAQAHNSKETKVETTDAITVANYTQIPVVNIYTIDGSDLRTDTDLLPSANNLKNLGSSSFKWANVYATTFNGNLSGNASSATTATKFNSTRKIELTGDVSGSATTDGSSGWSISTTVADDSHSHTVDTMFKPKLSKTYTGVIATANNQGDGNFYFIKVVPDAYGKKWFIQYRVYAEIAGVSDANGNGKEFSDVYIAGARDNYISYRTWNDIAHTSYRPYYYHAMYRARESVIAQGHGLGLALRSSYNQTTAANSRTVTFEIIDYEGCTVSFLDTPVKYTGWPSYSSSNYLGITEFDAATQGNTMSGDRNDPNYQNREQYASRTAHSFIGRYMLVLSRNDGTIIPTVTVDNNITTTKTYNTADEFDPFGGIFYFYGSGTTAAGGNVPNGYLYDQVMMDLRYGFNVGGYNTDSLITARKPFYLVATPQSNGMAKIHSSGFSQTLPTSDNGLIYIYLGTIYEDTYPYRLNLALHHPVYWYKNGAVRQFVQRAETANTANSATTAVSATKANYANNLLAYNSNETTIGANSSTAGSSTNNAIWFNYRDVQGGTITNDSTQIIDYYFGNRKGSVTGVKVHAANFVGDLTGNASTATSATKAAQDDEGHVIKTTYAKLASPTFTGVVTSPYYLATSQMTVSGGKLTSQLSTYPRAGLFADGVGITNPATRNDVGWIRMLGTGESDTIMEIATGDDGSEQIVARQYNASNAVVHELKLLDASGNTSVPNDLSIGGHVTLSYSSTTESLDFIFN